jgi:hypothetical protein
MMVTIWLVLIECDETKSEQDCILALGDNTSAVGWLFKRGKLPFDSPHYKPVQLISQKLARLVTDSSHCLASQHIKGKKNTVSDLLSFAGATRGEPHPLAPDYPSDLVLTERFHSCMPQLVPAGFDISPLPSKISCFIIQVLQTLESSLTQSKNQPTKRKTESDADGSCSVPRQVSTLTLSSLDCSSLKLSSSCARFSPSAKWQIGVQQEPFLASVRAPWFRQLCAMPQAIWLRRSGKRSRIHVEGSSQLLPAIKALLKAFDKTDPPPDRQKAITPKFLRKLFKFLNTATNKLSEAPTLVHVADLVLGAFFFAMRSCEHTKSVLKLQQAVPCNNSITICIGTPAQACRILSRPVGLT